MRNSERGNIAISVSLALVSAVAGSLLTLFLTDNLRKSASYEQAVPLSGSANEPASPQADLPLSTATDPFREPAPSTGDEQDLQQLKEELEAASEERSQLADIVAQLTRQLETLEADVINFQSINELTADFAEQHEGIFESGTDNANPASGRTGLATFDNLVAAGISADSAQALQTRQDQYQLARLELVDQAEREGWRDSDQFSERLDELDSLRPDLRSELGDDAYDRYLFAAGRNNRVSIVSIIPGSEAELAGLQIGDVVFSYAGERVFSTRELQSATQAGQRGEIVTIQVDRQGLGIFISAARGPLGVTLDRTKQNPS